MTETSPIWTPENGALLQQLRINAKMDIGTLAQRNMVSRIQVAQLEEGGDSAFYSPEIKRNVGKKLLAFFGHTLPSVTRSTAESAIKVEERAPEHLKTKAVPLKDTTLDTQIRAHSDRLEKASTQPVSKNNAGVKTIGALALVTGVLVITLQGQKSSPSTSLETLASNLGVAAEKEVAPQLAASGANITQTITPPTVAIETTAAVEPDVVTKNSVPEVLPPAPVAVSTKLSEAAQKCAWKDAETELQAPSPKKPAEYVYMVASKDLFVCVMDGQERVAGVSMKKGEGRSIYGPPPFKVQSTEMLNLKVYFQGQPIQLPNDEIRHIKLTAVSVK